MKQVHATSLRSIITARRGIAMFMAALILLSLSILALSSLSRISESTYIAGQNLSAKRLSILADSATRLALAEISSLFMSTSGTPAELYVNQTYDASGTSQFLVVQDKGDATTPATPFAFRAKASLILEGNGSDTLPGSEIPIARRNYCYDILIDTRELIKNTGATVVTPNLGIFTATDGTKYYFGQLKSQGVTTCFRKR